MNTTNTKALVMRNRVKTLTADKTQPAAHIDDLLVELGNAGKSIPFLVIYPADGRDPIILDGILTEQLVLDALSNAGASQPMARTANAP